MRAHVATHAQDACDHARSGACSRAMRTQKVVVHAPGGYSQLRLEAHPTPSPGAGEVRVRVHAIGVNYADCVVRMGLYESARKYVGFPITPGFEVAGVVDALGAGVDDLALGDAVIAVTRFGAYTTHLVVPRHQVFAKPSRLDFAEAAAFPTAALTAHFALHALAHVRDGESLLVHSAAGGVGSALVALGKRAGCRVVGVVGHAEKVEAARAVGCDVVIDKSREDLWASARRAAPDGYDVVLDANGASTLRESYASLGSPGRLVVYGFHSMLATRGGVPNPLTLALTWLRTPRFDPLRMTGENRSVLAFNLSYLFDRRALLEDAMVDLLGAVDAGALPPPRVRTFALADVREAHRALEGGRTVGKLALVVP